MSDLKYLSDEELKITKDLAKSMLLNAHNANQVRWAIDMLSDVGKERERRENPKKSWFSKLFG